MGIYASFGGQLARGAGSATAADHGIFSVCIIGSNIIDNNIIDAHVDCDDDLGGNVLDRRAPKSDAFGSDGFNSTIYDSTPSIRPHRGGRNFPQRDK